MELSMTKKQSEIVSDIIERQPKITVLYGAMRSGKTYLAVFLFLMFVRANAGKRLNFIIGGVNQMTIELNVLSVIEEMLSMTIRKDRLNSFWLYGNRIICFGGSDSSSWKAVRGFTAGGAMLNEGTALHDTFIKEVIARCSATDSRIVMDTNPDNPMHPLNTDYILHSGQKLSTGRLNIQAYHFQLLDNDKLDPEYIESIIMTTPEGMYTDRNIKGLWVQAEGLVYPMFDQRHHVVANTSSLELSEFHVSIDYGIYNPTAMGLWGLQQETGVWYKIKEYHHNGKQAGVQKTDEEYYRDLVDFTEGYEIKTVIVDPSASSFITLIRKRGRFSVRHANNAVLDGIGNTASALSTGRIKIDSSCRETIKEFNLYSWDTSSAKKGVDAPLKQNDHHMDETRYFVNTILRRIDATRLTKDQIEKMKRLRSLV